MSVIRSPSCTLVSSGPIKASVNLQSISPLLHHSASKLSPIKSEIKNTFYTDNVFSHATSEKIISRSTKRFEKIPVSRSRRSMRKDHLANIITSHKFQTLKQATTSQKKKGKLYDVSIINKAHFMDKVEEEKLIRIRQNSLKKLITHQLQNSKKNFWVSPIETKGEDKLNHSSLKRLIVHHKPTTENPPASIALNYLIHQYNDLFKHEKLIHQTASGLSKATLMEKCRYFKNCIRSGRYITSRVFAGIRQKDCFDVRAYIRFYYIFVGKTAKTSEKIEFLEFFFIPEGCISIEYEQLKLIVELLCEIQNTQNPEEMTELLLNQKSIANIITGSLAGKQCLDLSRPELGKKLKESEEIVELIIELIQR